MKKIYLKPATEEFLIASGAIMITASGEGEKIVDDGGDTDTGGVTTGDSRRRGRGNVRNQWEDDEMDEEQW